MKVNPIQRDIGVKTISKPYAFRKTKLPFTNSPQKNVEDYTRARKEILEKAESIKINSPDLETIPVFKDDSEFKAYFSNRMANTVPLRFTRTGGRTNLFDKKNKGKLANYAQETPSSFEKFNRVRVTERNGKIKVNKASGRLSSILEEYHAKDRLEDLDEANHNVNLFTKEPAINNSISGFEFVNYLVDSSDKSDTFFVNVQRQGKANLKQDYVFPNNKKPKKRTFLSKFNPFSK